MLDTWFLEAARSLIAADSVTDRGNLRAVAVLEKLWKEAGFATRRLPSDDTPERDANLLCGPVGAGAGDPVLLVTHLDTVEPGPRERWRTDPFSFEIRGDRAHGLGVADVKLDAICKLAAVRRLGRATLDRPVWFLGTYGEEAGLRGARAFMHAPPFRPRFVLCGEPCSLQIQNAHKGYAMQRLRLAPIAPARLPPGPRTRVTLAGKAAHSSTPALGVNAIDLALGALPARAAIVSIDGGASTNTIPAACEVVVAGEWLDVPGAAGERFEGPEAIDLAPLLPVVQALTQAWQATLRSLLPAADPRFTPDHAVGSVTLARTRNGALELSLDARLLPAHDVDAFHEAFARAVRGLGAGVATIEHFIERAANGMSLPDDAEIVRRVAPVLTAAGLDARPRAKPTSTEGGVFVRGGCEAIVFGPSPTTGNAHTANEFALLDEVERAIGLYEGMIRALAAA